MWVLGLVGVVMLASCGDEGVPPAETKQPTGGVKEMKLSAAERTELKENVRAALKSAVEYLRKAQHEDGSWGNRGGGVGKTGLVLEALARMPDDLREDCGDLIEKGVKYLLANRRENGSIVNEDGHVANYRTSIAARALIAIDREKYKDTIEAAVRYTKGIQGTDPDDRTKFGSMGYGSDPTKGDIINTGEALEMLARAGVKKDDPVWKRAMVFLGRTQNLSEYAEEGVQVGDDGGGFYRSDPTVEGASKAGFIELPDGTKVPRSYGGATYSLLKSLLFAGMKKDHPRVRAAYQWICDHYTVENHPEMKKQGLYYFYYTMARTLELWGSPTIRKGDTVHHWAEELAARITSLQSDNGSWINSVDRWMENDPDLVTAYALNALNICRKMMNE
jgi:squalene-hopene/tetraprenyl-beta-curcumene cyclase